MIKETDASKNDERRVKNKLNPLTHKKKGETRAMMGSQGMKIWKLGMFFVISLMLMVGVFAENVSAQSATVTVPCLIRRLRRRELIGQVVVTYKVTALIEGP